ncbi:hypothetical protein FE257_000081 [Aspergillus nanangensis]|uniref:Zn(2)-C6 fungal-type domain-containing protein n=1 Tax=Aspergillus nanangensis TaxID=2582783 RepID=A0AAD4CYU0_ASPNN|nr:hypothetical protein FE257_000081 [Aspergillus nanangensis]
MVTSPIISRQRPGSACEECRRRKVRCDRRRPQCQVCFENGIECKINTTRLPRGPRKAALERCLADQHPEISHNMTGSFDGSMVECDFEEDPFPDFDPLTKLRSASLHDDQTSEIKLPSSPDSPPRASGLVSDLMRADLDQLYFDRVHSFAPILQRWRYHGWAKDPKKTEGQVCLQYAMWTIAACLSAHFWGLRDALYQETRRMLDILDVREARDRGVGIEQAQAWVLISVYEYMHVSMHQAWMSAGRCCRLVLGMRLYELDDPNNPATLARDHDLALVDWADWAGLEEQRRTFWMAYSLDRFISLHSSLPFTLNEHLICTRLPSPEEDFQAGQPVVTRYLADVMAGASPDSHESAAVSPFCECIILATICGRGLAHRQKLAVEQINGAVYEGFWNRHQWLHEMVSHRIRLLSAPAHVDPMLVFARIIAQTMVLFLHNVLESITWKTGDHLLGIIDYERLCVLAAHEVLKLVKLQAQLGYFKVHPLTPIPLLMCADFFTAHAYIDPLFDVMRQEVVRCLQDLDRVKNPRLSRDMSA